MKRAYLVFSFLMILGCQAALADCPAGTTPSFYGSAQGPNGSTFAPNACNYFLGGGGVLVDAYFTDPNEFNAKVEAWRKANCPGGGANLVSVVLPPQLVAGQSYYQGQFRMDCSVSPLAAQSTYVQVGTAYGGAAQIEEDYSYAGVGGAK